MTPDMKDWISQRSSGFTGREVPGTSQPACRHLPRQQRGVGRPAENPRKPAQAESVHTRLNKGARVGPGYAPS